MDARMPRAQDALERPTYSSVALLLGNLPAAAGEHLVAVLRHEAPRAFRGAAVEGAGHDNVRLSVERKLVARLHVLAVEAQLLELRRVVALIGADGDAASGLAVATLLDREIEATGAAAFPVAGPRSHERADIRLCERPRSDQCERRGRQQFTHHRPL